MTGFGRPCGVLCATACLCLSLAACGSSSNNSASVTANEPPPTSKTTTSDETPVEARAAQEEAEEKASKEARPNTTTEAQTSGPSVAETLATLQGNARVSAGDALVRKFDHLLDALAPKCSESREGLADAAVTAHQLLANSGIDESLSTILHNVRESIPGDAPKLKCATDVFAPYVTLRRG